MTEESTRLFVGGLAWATDDRGLQEAFEKFGKVAEARVIVDRDSGRSRGFGFVTFEDARDCADALSSMNNQAWHE